MKKQETLRGLVPLTGLRSLVEDVPPNTEITVFLTEPLPAAQMHNLLERADGRLDAGEISQIGIAQKPAQGQNAVTVSTG